MGEIREGNNRKQTKVIKMFVGIIINDQGNFEDVFECQVCGMRTVRSQCECRMKEVWDKARGER